eukprot:831793-Prymnesium_polylepis.1
MRTGRNSRSVPVRCADLPSLAIEDRVQNTSSDAAQEQRAAASTRPPPVSCPPRPPVRGSRRARRRQRADLRMARGSAAIKALILFGNASHCVSESLPSSVVLHSANAECSSRSFNLGTQQTPSICATAARQQGCHTFMHSSSYPVWGCICCDQKVGDIPHPMWDVYTLMDLPPSSPPFPPPSPPPPVCSVDG